MINIHSLDGIADIEDVRDDEPGVYYLVSRIVKLAAGLYHPFNDDDFHDVPLMDSKPYETSWSAVTPFPTTFLIFHWMMFTLTILSAWLVICRLTLMAWLLLNWVTVGILRRFTVITP